MRKSLRELDMILMDKAEKPVKFRGIDDCKSCKEPILLLL